MFQDAAVPARYLQTFISYFASRGIDVASVLEAAGLTPSRFATPGTAITSSELERLLTHLYSQTGFAPDLFLRAGQVVTVGSHEILGYAMLSSPTIDHAWRIHLRYFNLITPAFRFEYQLDTKHAVIKHTPIGPFNSLSLRAFFESIASITNANVQEMTGGNVPKHDIHFSFERPPYAASFKVLKGARCHFHSSNSPQLKMVFPTQLVYRKLPMANKSALHMAEEQCKRLVRSTVASGRVSEWTSMMLREAHNCLPTLSDLAGTLNISTKTLNRHLQREGTNFRRLTDNMVRTRAIELLESGMPVTEIALTLGYSNPVNFTRAFNRLQGTSPSAYRKSLLNADEAQAVTDKAGVDPDYVID